MKESNKNKKRRSISPVLMSQLATDFRDYPIKKVLKVDTNFELISLIRYTEALSWYLHFKVLTSSRNSKRGVCSVNWSE